MKLSDTPQCLAFQSLKPIGGVSARPLSTADAVGASATRAAATSTVASRPARTGRGLKVTHLLSRRTGRGGRGGSPSHTQYLICAGRRRAARRRGGTLFAMASHPTIPISVPYPQVERPHLKITIGPCRLRVTAGAAEAFVTGRYEDPTGMLPLQVTHGADQVSISQSTQLGSIGSLTQAPGLDLQLGTRTPFEL